MTNLLKVVTQLLPQIQLSTRCATAPPTGISIELDMIIHRRNLSAKSLSAQQVGLTWLTCTINRSRCNSYVYTSTKCACFIFIYNVVRTRISDGGGDVL